MKLHMDVKCVDHQKPMVKFVKMMELSEQLYHENQKGTDFSRLWSGFRTLLDELVKTLVMEQSSMRMTKRKPKCK